MEKYFFLNKNLGRNRKQIFDVFFKLGAPLSSLNRWITRLESNEKLDRVTGSGRPIKIANIYRIKQKINHRSGCTQRKVAKQLKTTQQYVFGDNSLLDLIKNLENKTI